MAPRPEKRVPCTDHGNFADARNLASCFAVLLLSSGIGNAAVALWWSFENVIDCVPYIADALPMKLMLTSGGTGSEMEYGFHDWNYILSEWGMLVKCDVIAARVNVVGLVGAALCVLWGAWSLWYYWMYQRGCEPLHKKD